MAAPIEKIMWNFIDKIDWPGRCSLERRPYNSAKRYLFKNHTFEACMELRKFVQQKANELTKRLDEYHAEHGEIPGFFGGDDSFSDMVHHVVGCGEKAFNATMKDPRVLDGLEYVESFSYAIPYDAEDWERGSAEHYQKRAKKALISLKRIMRDNAPDPKSVEVINELKQRFQAMLDNDFEAATEDFNYDRCYEFDANDQMARFSNIIGDCINFYA